MTNKLKKNFNKIVLSVLIGATCTFTFGAIKSNSSAIYERMTTEEEYLAEQALVLGKTETEVIDGNVIVCDSIVQGIRDSDLEDGQYTFRVKTEATEKDYAVELINYREDVIYSLSEGETTKTISLGDNTTEYKMLVVKYHKNLTVEKGVTVTASMNNNLTYKKGMYICVMGDLKNAGTISMTARGTYNQAGEDVYLWKNTDNTYEYVPALGAERRSITVYK